ncbi:MAG: hypothetical protein ACI90V_009191, partial [Bacillariaceae sp.]
MYDHGKHAEPGYYVQRFVIFTFHMHGRSKFK